MKKVLLLVLSFSISVILNAQVSDTVYLDEDFHKTDDQADAKYFRLKQEELTNGLTLWYTFDFKGVKRESIHFDERGIQKGAYELYYSSGVLKKEENKGANKHLGDVLSYHENGQLESVLVFNPDGGLGFSHHIISYYDSNGTALATNGTGYYEERWENGVLKMKGNVKDKIKDGEWIGYHKTGEKYYVEQYGNNDLVSGVSYDDRGNEYSYTKLREMPIFTGGQEELLKYLAKMEYPREAKEKDIQGTSYIRFIIDTKGKVTNVQTAKSSHPILDKVAEDHVTQMPYWKAGYDRGQKMRTHYIVPIKFNLGNSSDFKFIPPPSKKGKRRRR